MGSVSQAGFRFGFFIALALTVRAANVPAGTEVQIRLTSEVSSDKPSGQPVQAVVIAPVFVNGVPVLPAGTQVLGTTADAKANQPAAGTVAEVPATLRLQFTTLRDQAAHQQSFSCVVNSVDNGREKVDSAGLITGITASQTYEARLDQGLNKLANHYAGIGQLLTGVKGALLKQVDPSITYQAGVELSLRVTHPFSWDWAGTGENVAAITPAAPLAALVNGQPFRTRAENPPKPSDMTNLVFIGSQDQIEAAFKQAGWFSAAALSGNSKIETARAIIEDRGYSEAPMSVLFLDDRPPDLTFQKQNNTFSMRHHIRIWQRPDKFDGKPLWVAAATHDNGVTFSEASRNFTHAIDPNIDNERSKVMNDLLFTGTVRALALLDRTGIPKDATNATGDHLVTDGKMAVLEF